MQEKFDAFRKQYPEFIYRDYHIDIVDGEYVELTYDFEIPGLCEFHPSNRIRTSNLEIINSPDSSYARVIAFLPKESIILILKKSLNFGRVKVTSLRSSMRSLELLTQ